MTIEKPLLTGKGKIRGGMDPGEYEASADDVSQAQEKVWAEENASAIEERREWLKKTGMPLADSQILRID
ncbi:MAG: type II toxin-antitoxin system CcdA family antitoxin [Thalassovita sp.]|nr:type II toxin-antitoxin system CcdA family antitoxin [Thalassovita sp.]